MKYSTRGVPIERALNELCSETLIQPGGAKRDEPSGVPWSTVMELAYSITAMVSNTDEYSCMPYQKVPDLYGAGT
jgi:hypothetical protein